MKLRLPSRFQDMTLGQLQAIHTGGDMLAVLSSCTGQPKEQLRQLPHALLSEAYEHVQNISEQETTKHLVRFMLDGTEYGFIPNWDEFTAGEWIDAEMYSEDFWPNAHKLMSVLFRPVERTWGDRYSIEPYTAKERQDVFLTMPADQVAGALLFFSTTKSERLNILRSSLIRAAVGRTSSQKNGAGILSSMRSLANRILKSMRSHGHRWGIYSRTWRF